MSVPYGNSNHDETGTVKRAQGCLLGQLSGDALGSLVEFRTADEIRREYTCGVRELADGGTFNTIVGQPTNDSEMSLMLARMLVKQRSYDAEAARTFYVYWFNSGPFDCGNTVSSGLRGQLNPDSQANGALMRISPLGIFGANYEVQQVAT
jgi:ADP-ribosylglycohydrolase